MYKFSSDTVAEFYNKEFYSISNMNGKVVAYSENVFEVPKKVRFLGEDKCLIFKKAVIRGGVIWGGEIWGGEIWGGVIRGGVIRGGVHEHGNIEVSLLQIQGNRHFCYAYFNRALEVEIGIGCERHSIEWWQENYKQVGEKEKYTQDEIDEYRQYIQLFASRYKK